MAVGGGLRQMMRELAHRPLQGDTAQRFLWLLGLPADGCLEKANQGVHNKFCLTADATSLSVIGGDRLIPQGLTESAENYALRLQRAFDDWQLAGGPWAVMRQVLGYLLDHAPNIATVQSRHGATGTLLSDVWDYFFAGADTTKSPVHQRDNVSPAWDWDSLSPNQGSWGHWRWWLVIYSVAPADVFGPVPFLIGDPGITIGTDATVSVGLNCAPSVIGNMRQIVKLWKSAHSKCDKIVITFDAALFDPQSPSGGGVNPDGLFGRHSKIVSGNYTAARFADARYCTGV